MSRQYPPQEINLDNGTVDLQTVTTYDSPILNVTTQFSWLAVMKIVNVGGAATTGLAKFTVRFYDDLAGTTLIAEKDTVIDIDTKVDGQQELMRWGGPGSSHDGSGTPSAGADSMGIANFMRITVEVTEVNNAGTSADASVWLLAEETVPG